MKSIQNCKIQFFCCLSGYFLLLFCNSCSSSAYYSPVMQGKAAVYQPKPMQSDSIKSNTYIHAVYGFSAENETNDGEQFLALSYSKAHVLKKANISYGAFGAFGAYINGEFAPDNPDYFTYKKFSVWGISTSANLVSVSGRTEFRFPGVELAISKEFGEYATYRRNVISEPGYYVNTHTLLVSVAGSAEIVWHNKKKMNHQYGIRLLFGRTLGNEKMYGYNNDTIHHGVKNMIFYTSYFFKFNRVALVFDQSFTAGKLGLIYCFK